MSVTIEEIEALWVKMDKVIRHLAANPGVIKRQKYEADLLALYGDARDRLEESLRDDRQRLVDLFGGDCVRIAQLSTILDSQEFSTPGAIKDQRTGMCRKMCTNVMGVLQDLGLSERLRKAQDAEESKWKHGASSDNAETAETPASDAPPESAPAKSEEAKSVESAAEAAPEAAPEVAEAPEAGAPEASVAPKAAAPEVAAPEIAGEPDAPDSPAQKSEKASVESPVKAVDLSEADAATENTIDEQAKANPLAALAHLGRIRKSHEPCSIQVVSNSLCDDQTETICASESLETLRALECPHRTEYPGPWMVYQVHRAYLNDPKLTSLDFTNMHMPSGKNEPCIAPKLMKCLKHNTHLTTAILDNSNCQTAEMPLLAESLSCNSTLAVLNFDNNAVSNEALTSIANAIGSKTSGAKVLQVYNQLSEPNDTTELQTRLLDAAKKNDNLIKILFEFEEPIKTQVEEACTVNYNKRPCCIGCAFKIPVPCPAEAQCQNCKRFVCSTTRRCPLDSKLKTLKQAFEKGLPFELVGFPQHCWRNPVELDNLRAMMQKGECNVFQAMDKTEVTKENSGKMCKYCIAYTAGEALFEYYRQTNDGTSDKREACPLGKNCRTQTHNMKHATSFNHVMPPN